MSNARASVRPCYPSPVFQLWKAAVAISVGKDASAQERGKYLANAVAICFHCHSERDWQHSPGGLPASGRLGGGRVLHPGFRLTFPNITPDRETGAGAWSDEDFYRALTQGIGHDGRTLYIEMPYLHSRSFPTRTWRPSSFMCDRCRRCATHCQNPKFRKP